MHTDYLQINIIKYYFYYCTVFLIISVLLWHAVPMPAGHFDIDSYGYDSIALHFAQENDLTDPHHPESAPIQPVGYPFIVGTLYKIFGHDVRPILIMQIFLMCIALGLTMQIAHCIGGITLARIAGLLFLLSPCFYIYSQLLLAETIVMLLLLFVIERFLSFLQTESLWTLSIVGFCTGVSMIIKPVVMLLMMVLGFMCWLVFKNRGKRKAVIAIVLLFCSFAVPMFVYIVRNYVRYGQAFFAPMMPLNMYQIFLSKVMGELANKDPQEIIETELRFKGSHSFDVAGWDHARTLFFLHLKVHPMLCANIWCINVCKTWCGLYTTQLKKMIEFDGSLIGHSFFLQSGTGFEKMRSYVRGATSKGWIIALSWYESVRSLLQLLFAFYGLCILFCNNRLYGWFFLGICISLSLPTGIDGCCRYRIFFEVILVVLSALTFLRMYRDFFIKKGESMLFNKKKYMIYGLLLIIWHAQAEIDGFIDSKASQGVGGVYYVFLAGGNGERLWPLSNDTLPKQLLPLGPDGTLLGQTIDRVSPLTDKQHMWISTTEKHEAQITHVVGDKVGTVLIEPGSRNTAPAILLCCMKIYQEDPAATVIFLPADAFIPKSDWRAFREYLAVSIDHAQRTDDVVLLGVQPTYPATGYGYIEFDKNDLLSAQAPYKITRFREKPSLDVAQQYLEEGNKLWNIGIFVGKSKSFINEYKKYAPEIYKGVKEYINGQGSYNRVPKDSIDYAVMERSKNIAVMPVDVAWCDVGNVEVFLTLKQQYSTLNAKYISIDAKNNLVDVPGKTVALVGVNDLCIVETDGALLITKRDAAEKVRSVVDILRQSGY